MSEELKPCPFCGCERVELEWAYWNTRPVEDQLRAENERLRVALKSVEWVQGVCIFCGGFEPSYSRTHNFTQSGHYKNCSRQVALYGEYWKEKE